MPETFPQAPHPGCRSHAVCAGHAVRAFLRTPDLRLHPVDPCDPVSLVSLHIAMKENRLTSLPPAGDLAPPRASCLHRMTLKRCESRTPHRSLSASATTVLVGPIYEARMFSWKATFLPGLSHCPSQTCQFCRQGSSATAQRIRRHWSWILPQARRGRRALLRWCLFA